VDKTDANNTGKGKMKSDGLKDPENERIDAKEPRPKEDFKKKRRKGEK